MSLQITSPPAAEPVTLAQVKQRLRLSNTNDDAMLTQQITAAREFAEKVANLSLANKGYVLYRDEFPWSGCALEIPKTPVTGVTSISYLDPNGDLQTWDSDLYTVYNLGMARVSGVIKPIPGGAYPATLRGFPQTVIVSFNAGFGYGTAAPYTPAFIQESIIRLTVYLYQNPDAVLGKGAAADPLGAVSILHSDKEYSF